MARYWIAVASKEHVQRGIDECIAQVCHGKQNPLKRMKARDWLIYYSPTELFGQKIPCRKFTAIGQVADEQVYQFKMNDDFIPWRRKINFLKAYEVAIEPLIDKLSFIKNKRSWGMVFRYGLIEIPVSDFKLIASHMGILVDE
ncbi:MAG: EVE domain-containing protein [Candidatus Dependentiae bacterium]